MSPCSAELTLSLIILYKFDSVVCFYTALPVLSRRGKRKNWLCNISEIWDSQVERWNWNDHIFLLIYE